MWGLATWWLVGAVALAFTAVSLLGLRDRIVALYVADAASVMLWVLWAVQAFAVELTTETGSTVVQQYPSLGYLGLAFAVVMVLDLFVSVFEAMAANIRRDTDGE